MASSCGENSPQSSSASSDVPQTNDNDTVSKPKYSKLGVAGRTTCVLLRASGLPLTEIERITNVKASTVRCIFNRAVERGFNPVLGPSQTMQDEWFADAAKTGRPRKRSASLTKAVAEIGRLDSHGREKSCSVIANELKAEGIHVSETTVWRLLRDTAPKRGAKRHPPRRVVGGVEPPSGQP